MGIWGSNLEEITKKAIINAFIASEVVQAALQDLSDTINQALADGQLTDAELLEIEGIEEDLAALGGPLNEILKRLGLIKAESEDLFDADTNLSDLRDILGQLEGAQGLFEQGITVEINGVEVTPEAAEEAAKQITEGIKSSLSITTDDFSSILGNALSNATSVADFTNNYRDSIREATKNAIIQGFLQSEPIVKQIEFISDKFFEFLEDGLISPDEQAILDGLIK